MIRSMGQARAVQKRRVKAGKRGWARAVRKYLVKRSITDLGSLDWYCYNELKQQLAVIHPYEVKNES